jgi:glycine oxidase
MTESHSSHSHDALVVGGGVIGLACAWRAARRGLDVCVLERDRPGAGASGVAAGMLAPAGEAAWGEEDLLALNLASHRLWPSFARELAEDSGREPGHLTHGALHVALDRDEAGELRRRHRLHRELGLSSSWLRPAECRRVEPGLAPGLSGGMLAEADSSIDPGLLCEALAAAVERRGGRVEPGADVEAMRVDGVSPELRIADGRTFAARSVVLAAGCWSGQAGWVPEESRPPVRPVKGEILTLRGSREEPLCGRMVVTERAYIVPRADGRVIVGATVEERGFDTTVTAGGVHELLREAYRVLPDVAELELLEARAGLRPGTPDNSPLIGRTPAVEGLVIATGHYRNGVLLAPITAESVAALLADEQPPIDVTPFSPARFEPARKEAALG